MAGSSFHPIREDVQRLSLTGSSSQQESATRLSICRVIGSPQKRSGSQSGYAVNVSHAVIWSLFQAVYAVLWTVPGPCTGRVSIGPPHSRTVIPATQYKPSSRSCSDQDQPVEVLLAVVWLSLSGDPAGRRCSPSPPTREASSENEQEKQVNFHHPDLWPG